MRSWLCKQWTSSGVRKPKGCAIPHVRRVTPLLSLTVINMANDNSRSPKDSKKRFLSPVVEPITSFFNNSQRSVPSEGSQGHSKRQKLFSKFTSTSPIESTLFLLLTSSTMNAGGEIPLGMCRISSVYILNCNPIVDSSTVPAPDGMPPNRSSVVMDSQQYQDHRIPPASFGSQPLVTPSAVQSECHYLATLRRLSDRSLSIDLDDLSPPQGPTTTASAGQSFGENTLTSHCYWRLTLYNLRQGRTGISAGIGGSSQSAKPNARSSIKENLKLTGRALQTLITRAAPIVDSNPAKVTLGLVRAIIEIKNVRYRFSHRILTDYHSRL